MRPARFIGYGAAALLACGSTAALAQATSQPPAQTGPAATASTDLPGNGEIIVTAQRRDTSLSKTPVAISVVSGESLERAQIKTQQDLRIAVPGLEIRSSNPPSAINYALRGQSLDIASDSRPSVLPYFNDVPIAGQSVSSSLYDLGSVQVLKGPQGTLFGRSATGGAILYTSAKPVDDFEGYVDLGYGNYDAKTAQGAINVPIVKDTVLLRVAGYYSDRHGYQHNLYNNTRVGDMERDAFRASLTIKSGNFRNDLVVDYYHSNGQSVAGIVGGIPPFGSDPAVLTPGALLYGGTTLANGVTPNPAAIAAGSAVLAGFTGQTLAQATAQYINYFTPVAQGGLGNDPRGLQAQLALQNARGPYVVDFDNPDLNIDHNIVVTNTTAYDLSSDIRIKNIFGYGHSHNLNSYDNDQTSYGFQKTVSPESIYRIQYTDELQIGGKALDGRLNFVAGGFYSNEKTDYRITLSFFDIAYPDNAYQTAYHHDLTSKTAAGYAQGTYNLNDKGLSVTAGLRYTSEKVGDLLPADNAPNYTAAGNLCLLPGYSCDQSRTFNNLSYTFGIQDQIDPSTLLYITTRRAYKSGGFNGDSPPKIGLGTTNGGNGFLDEHTSDVEAGAKFNGRLSGMPTHLDLAAYYSWLVDAQRSVVVLAPAPASINVNLPSVHIYGVEFDGNIKPAAWLTLGAIFNYTKGKFPGGMVTVLGSPVDFSRLQDTPVTSGSLFADVNLPMTQSLELQLHGDVYHQAQSFTSPIVALADGTTMPRYTLVNFRVGINDEGQGWSLTANLKNALNKVYFVGGFPLGAVYDVNTLLPGEPRMVTVDVKYKF